VTKEKPVILIIENSPAVTGALKSIVRSSRECSNTFKFVFILPSGSKGKDLVLKNGFEVQELTMIEIRKNIFHLLAYIPMLLFNVVRLSAIIRRHKPYLIVNNDFYNLLPAAYRFFGGSLPYVCYVRFLPSKFPAPLVRVWCKAHDIFAREIVAVSEAVKKELILKKDIKVIYNELPAGEVVFSPPSSNIILYCANYIHGKGQEHALESFALITQRYPQWKLRFAGGDMGLQKNIDFKESLVARARKLGVDGQVEWLGFENDILALYTGACFTLNFSESESFSMTCLESMFYGRTVIATRSGGPAEIIDDGVTGLLVNLGDVESMSRAIEYLISHPKEREIMSRNAYKAVRDKFSMVNTAEKLRKLYETILNSKN